MNVQFHVVGGMADEIVANVTVGLDAVPREGETVTLPGVPDHLSIVRTVVWYPLGDPAAGTEGPFVYVVVGRGRT